MLYGNENEWKKSDAARAKMLWGTNEETATVLVGGGGGEDLKKKKLWWRF